MKKQIVKYCKFICAWMKLIKVPRAAASAVAFGTGLFLGKGTLGPGHNRAFSVVTESLASDVLLQFNKICATYKVYIYIFFFLFIVMYLG